MVTVRIGEIFQSDAQTLVNTINCVGVMGKGIALGFKERFHDMFEDYVARCEAKQVKLGEPYLYRRLTRPWILNFPTKDHWRSVSSLEDIVRGLEYLRDHYESWGIESLAVPPLGCGEGQLEWRVVGPTLFRHLRNLDIPVELYAPYGTPHEELQPAFLELEPVRAAASGPDRIGAGWAALVDILARIEAQPYHWPIGRVSFQKLAYFATDAGIPTGLQYKRGSYGPYAADLKRRTTALVNNSLIREERLGRMFAVKVGSTFVDARRAYQAQLEEWGAVIERIADLFLRMDTKQAEIAATVHFACRQLAGKGGHRPSEREVLDQVMTWKQKRRPPLQQPEVAKAIRGLAMLGWLPVDPSDELPVEEEELLDV